VGLSSAFLCIGFGCTHISTLNHPRQYAYAPPSTSQYIPQRLSHTQAAPRQFQRSEANQAETHRMPAPQTQQHRTMLPPPTPVRFKPAVTGPTTNNKPSQAMSSNQIQNDTDRHRQCQQNMGPPPTPARIREQQSRNPQATQALNNAPAVHSSRQSTNTQPPSNRLVPSAQRFPPPSIVMQSQRPTPPTTSISGPQRFMPPGSRAPSRAGTLHISGSGQRTPFVPGAQEGFM
jgi:hypothetical protein